METMFYGNATHGALEGRPTVGHQIHTEITIDAPAGVVWDVLTELDRYSEWNPFIVESRGRAAVGERLTNRLLAPGGKTRTFRPTVTEVQTGQSFEWLGRLGTPGLFDGRHRFELQFTDTGQTAFTHSEQFTGVLVPLMRSALDTDTAAGFAAMNTALKERAEARARSGA